MEEALLVPNIRLFFEHRPQTVDFHQRVMNVRDVVGDTMKQIEFDLCIGADGSHSFVRRQLMRVTRYVLRCSICLLCHPPTHVSPSRTVGMSGSCYLGSSIDPCICGPEWTISKSIFPTNIWSSGCQRSMIRTATQYSLLIQITSTYGHAIHLCLWGWPIRCAIFHVDYYLAPLFLNANLCDLIG
jgi:hypothetical protein